MQEKGGRFVNLYGKVGVNPNSNQETAAENKKQENRNYPGECNLREGRQGTAETKQISRLSS